ncbi:MAG: helix-turn-helix domain-containing protein [Pseudonocardiales bacterium]|nr:helix-turn-helix domain-containing protein [Pseudonocardiales bacterium]
MLRVKAVAEMFDVSPQTIYRAIESGKLDALKLGSGRAVRIPEHALRAFVEGCSEAAYRSFVVGGESVASANQRDAGQAGAQ